MFDPQVVIDTIGSAGVGVAAVVALAALFNIFDE